MKAEAVKKATAEKAEADKKAAAEKAKEPKEKISKPEADSGHLKSIISKAKN